MPGKEPQFPLNRRMGGPQGWSKWFYKEKIRKSFAPAGIQTPAV